MSREPVTSAWLLLDWVGWSVGALSEWALFYETLESESPPGFTLQLRFGPSITGYEPSTI